jgi:hypothetical protein
MFGNEWTVDMDQVLMVVHTGIKSAMWRGILGRVLEEDDMR